MLTIVRRIHAKMVAIALIHSVDMCAVAQTVGLATAVNKMLMNARALQILTWDAKIQFHVKTHRVDTR